MVTFPQLIKKFPVILEFECSLPSHQSPSPVFILSQMSSVFAIASNFCKINFNTILPSTFRNSKCVLSPSFSHQNPACISLLSHTCHMPANAILLCLITLMTLGEWDKLCNFLNSLFTSPLSNPNISIFLVSVRGKRPFNCESLCKICKNSGS
jgi:hypothetical protein